MNGRIIIYQERYEKFSNGHLAIKSLLLKLSWLRVLAFFLMIILPVYLAPANVWMGIGGALLSLTAFLYLIILYIKYEKKKKLLRYLSELNKNELLVLAGGKGGFDGGGTYADKDHEYTDDFDIFGKDSLFQYLNRTSTCFGKDKLADVLKHPSKQKQAIQLKQEAIRELAEAIEWRQLFYAQGKAYEEKQEDRNTIEKWGKEQLICFTSPLYKYLVIVLPVVTIAAIVLALLGTMDWTLFKLAVFTQWAMIGIKWNNLQRIHNLFGKRTGLLRKYYNLFQHIMAQPFESEELSQLQNRLKQNGNAGENIRKLEKIIAALDSGMNLFGGFIFNSLLLWNIRHSYELVKWHNRFHKKLPLWFDVIGEFEMLSSLATLAYNHPSYTYPEIGEHYFTYEAEGMGHPLIPADRCVTNEFSLSGKGKITIVTGANMAGKSTFLRTAGVNLLLGMCGAPVCAAKMKFSPVGIYSNMRTADSLADDESYFFAELKSLKRLLDKLEAGEKYFIVLDEILKGTNSIDKLNGSREFVKQLMALESVGMVATHDLKLSELEQEHPSHIINKCFEVELTENELLFTYKLSDGVTQTMNATFLMKRMGIIKEEEN